jgi:hypothetical protein
VKNNSKILSLVLIVIALVAGGAGQLYVDRGFFPSFMGDVRDLTVLQHDKTIPHPGSNCINITYSAKKSGGEGWGGIYWQYPDQNWGDYPGRNLNWARILTFWARGKYGGEKAEFKIGGINGKYTDSINPPVSTGVKILTTSWKQFEIDISEYNKSSVIGGFCWVTNSSQNPNGCTIYLDDLIYVVKPEDAYEQGYYQYRRQSQAWKSWSDPAKYFDIFVWITSGYGIRPLRTVLVSVVLIVIFTIIFILGHVIIHPTSAVSGRRPSNRFLDAFLFSAQIFFTHHPPAGWGYLDRWKTAILLEDVSGWILTAMFVATLVNVLFIK